MKRAILIGGLLAAALPSWAAEPQLPAHFAVGNGFTSLMLSPDGSRVAGMVHAEGRRALVSKRLDGSERQIAFVLDKPDFELQLRRWLGNDRVLLELSNYKPGPIYGMRLPVSRLLAIQLDGKDPKVLYDDRRQVWTNHKVAELPQPCRSADSLLMPGSTGRDDVGVERMDTRSGLSRSVQPSMDGVAHRWWADAQGRVRLAWVKEKDGRQQLLLRQPLADQPDKLGRWLPWREIPLAEADQWQLLGFDADPQRLLVRAPLDGKNRLLRLALDGDAPPQVLLELPAGATVDQLLHNEADCRAVAARVRGELLPFGDELDALLGGIRAALPDTQVQLRQWQGERYLVEIGSANRPPEFLVGQRKAGTLQAVASSHAQLPVELAIERRPLAADARLLLPKGRTGPLPLVVCLSCELRFADEVGPFKPLAAMLAAQGHAVLQVSGDKRWLDGPLARQVEPHLSRLDGLLATLRADGLVDGERVAVIGGSALEAYAALRWAMARETPLRAIVVSGALTHLPRLRAGSRAQEISDATRAYQRKLIGDLDRSALELASPALQAARLRAPTLLLHGDHDARLPIEQSQDLHKALQKLGTPTRLLAFVHSGSELDHPPYRREAYEAISAWLAEHL